MGLLSGFLNRGVKAGEQASDWGNWGSQDARVEPPHLPDTAPPRLRAGEVREALGRVVLGDKGEAGKRLSLLLCDQREEPNSSPEAAAGVGGAWSWVPALLMTHSGAWQSPSLTFLAPSRIPDMWGHCRSSHSPKGQKAQVAASDLPGGGWVQAELGWAGASGTPEALTGALGSEPRRAELPTVGRAG